MYSEGRGHRFESCRVHHTFFQDIEIKAFIVLTALVTVKKLGSPDLKAIPIGAYEPMEFMKSAHINPEEAVKVFSDLGAKYAISVHWGTFKLTLEPMNEPPIRLKNVLKATGVDSKNFRTLKHGEMWPEVLPN